MAFAQDLDADGVPDASDDCPSVPDPTQTAVFDMDRPVPLLDWSWGVSSIASGDVDGDGDTDVLTDQTLVRQGPGGVWTVEPSAEGRLADLDGDGDLDAYDATNGLQWWANAGDGTFGPGRGLGAGSDTSDAIAVDLDGDGDLDLVAVGSVVLGYGYGGYGYQQFTGFFLLENLGSGTFGPEIVVSTQNGRTSPALAAGDFDGDGDVDVAHVDGWYADIGWLENVGGLWMVDHPLRTRAANAATPAAGDLDGDGAADLVVASSDDALVLLRRGGPGGLGPEQVVPSGLGLPYGAAIVDLDRDGAQDLLVASEGAFGFWQGLGPAGLAPMVEVWVRGSGPLAVGDLDGSGTLDVLLGDSLLSTLHVVPNLAPPDRDGQGGCDADDVCPFDPADPCVDADGDGLSDEDEAVFGTRRTSADSDGDGLSDLEELLDVGTDPLLPDTDGDGALDGAQPCPLGDDADADGWCDPVDVCPSVADPGQVDTDEDGVGDLCDDCVVDPDPGQGVSFGPFTPFGLGYGPTTAADLDEDGDLDLLVPSGRPTYGLWWLPNLGGATFGAPISLGGWADEAQVVDVDVDGIDDLLIRTHQPGLVQYAPGLGGGTYGARRPVASGIPFAESALAADLDGDGDPDVLVGAEDLWYAENLGGGVFGPTTRMRRGTWEREVQALDLDGDGDLDLLTAGTWSTAVWRYENLGGGRLAAPVAISTVGDESGLQHADLDGDGDEDVVVTSPLTGDLRWIEHLGGLAFGAERVIEPVSDALSALPTDLDRDGDVDLVSVLGGQREEARWYENDGLGSFAPHELATSIGVSCQQLRPADLDGDGDDDLTACRGWFEDLLTPDRDRDGTCDGLDDDADGDGVPAALDCDDLDPRRFPGAVEIAGDGIDEDCDGADPPAPRDTGDTGLLADTGLPQDTGLPADTGLPQDTGPVGAGTGDTGAAAAHSGGSADTGLPGHSGRPTSDAGTDTGVPGEPDGPGADTDAAGAGCGCASGGRGAGILGPAPLLLLLARRRQWT